MSNQNKLKILHLTNWYPHPENQQEGCFVRDQIKASNRHNQIIVIFLQAKGQAITDQEEDGLRTIRMPFFKSVLPGYSFFRHRRKLSRLVLNLQREGFTPDLIHCHIWSAGFYGKKLAKQFNVPLVITVHSSVFTKNRLSKTYRRLARYVLNQADLILPVSDYLGQAIARIGVKTRIMVVPNIVDQNFISNSPPPQFNNLICITSFYKEKGLDQLIEAISHLANIRRDFNLKIIGQGNQYAYYQNLITKKGLASYIQLPGQLTREQIAAELQNSKLLIQPSQHETFSVVVIEALASGRPVVANDLPVMQEKINKQTGLLVKKDDAKQMAEAINQILNNYDQYSADKISEYTSSLYSQEVVADKLQEMYQSLQQQNQEKALIITYSFPPVGGGGVQRTTKFVKYLKEFGWDCVVLTTKGLIKTHQDTKLLEEVPLSTEVVRNRFLSPEIWLTRLAVAKKNFPFLNTLYKIVEKLVFGLTALLFIPDNAAAWLLPGYRTAKKIIKKDNIKVIYSTSGAHTAHLIALRLKNKFNLPWVADFRDEWTLNPFKKYLTPWHKKKHQRLEKEVLQTADQVISVSEMITDDLAKIAGSNPEKFITITNGYDSADFPEQQNNSRTNKFIVTYTGTIYDQQSPDNFLKAVEELLAEEKIDREKLKVRFIGTISNQKFINLAQPIKKVVDFVGYQNHQYIISALQQSSVQLLYISNERGAGCYTGKIFEYLATKQPILAIVPLDGLAAKLIQKTKTGLVADPDHVDQIKNQLLKLYQAWLNDETLFSPDQTLIKYYDRRQLTKRLADVFQSISK
ncbi:MAG: glycosyltransferase [Patescibacteria group bacterium]